MLVRPLLSRVPAPSRRLLLLALVAYLAIAFDLVRDFLPVAGQLDHAIIVAVVLQRAPSRGRRLIREHWPGATRSLDALVRLAGPPAHV